MVNPLTDSSKVNMAWRGSLELIFVGTSIDTLGAITSHVLVID